MASLRKVHDSPETAHATESTASTLFGIFTLQSAKYLVDHDKFLLRSGEIISALERDRQLLVYKRMPRLSIGLAE